MRAGRVTGAVALILAGAALTGCAEGGLAGSLRSAGVGETPDEFLVLPTKPLELPEDTRALPPPTPGRANRVDYQPEFEAVAALTGRPGPAGSGSAAVLIARAGPVDPAIRSKLAAEDATYREQNGGRLLERIFNKDDDALIYEGMALEAGSEFERMRARGLRVPAAPPASLPETVEVALP